MPLLALAAVVLVAALAAGAIAWRYPRAAGETVEVVAESAAGHGRLRPFLRRRRDPVAATGLALTAALR